MKLSGFCALILVIWTTFMFLSFLSTAPTVASLFPDFAATSYGDYKPTLTVSVSRKLKENGRSNNEEGDNGGMTLDDYRPITPVPVPAGGESFVHAPIQHGTPLNPYIPKPPPPSNPDDPE